MAGSVEAMREQQVVTAAGYPAQGEGRRWAGTPAGARRQPGPTQLCPTASQVLNQLDQSIFMNLQGAVAAGQLERQRAPCACKLHRAGSHRPVCGASPAAGPPTGLPGVPRFSSALPCFQAWAASSSHTCAGGRRNCGPAACRYQRVAQRMHTRCTTSGCKKRLPGSECTGCPPHGRAWQGHRTPWARPAAPAAAPWAAARRRRRRRRRRAVPPAQAAGWPGSGHSSASWVGAQACREGGRAVLAGVLVRKRSAQRWLLS